MKKVSTQKFLPKFIQKVIFSLILIWIFFPPLASHAIVILDFESATPGLLQTADYIESGFRISVNNHYDISGIGDQRFQIDTYGSAYTESAARIDYFGQPFDLLGVEIFFVDYTSTIKSSSGGNYEIRNDGWLLLSGPEWNNILWLEFSIAKPDPITAQYNLVIDNVLLEVPEPSTLVLIGLGLVGLAGFGRKKIMK